MAWVRLDEPGAEAATLVRTAEGWRLNGTVVVAEAGVPAALEYAVDLDSAWVTRRASVRGHVGGVNVETVLVHERGSWRLNGATVEGLAEAVDVDLAFSPATNLLPLRRLSLEAGQPVRVVSAWLQYPSFTVAPLLQVYTRVSATEVRYEAEAHGFAATLSLHRSGFVRLYPGLWRMVGASPSDAVLEAQPRT